DPTRAKIAGSIKQAASTTGASFEYLLATAKMESNFNPKAAASTSSARGLFQFIDQTWLGTVKEAGSQLGYGKYADAISKDSERGRGQPLDLLRSLGQRAQRLRGLFGAEFALRKCGQFAGDAHGDGGRRRRYPRTRDGRERHAGGVDGHCSLPLGFSGFARGDAGCRDVADQDCVVGD